MPSGCRSAGERERPNVLLVVLDTVRADRLSSYGYARATTPELDVFAADAIRFPNFYATSSWTIPSHASLFTGRFPIEHGATQEQLRFDARLPTLAELLAGAGYRTWGASGNPFVGPATGLARGFERFVETWRDELDPGTSRAAALPHPANQAFARFLAEGPREQPFFAFVNYMDAHHPYLPPPRCFPRFLRRPVPVERALELARRGWADFYLHGPYPQQDLETLSDLYDGEVRCLSQEVGRLLETLRKDGRYEDTLVVVTSDHGEHFGENDLLAHMFGLYNTTVRVPLLIRPPGGPGALRLDERPAQLVDLFATILRRAGVDAPLAEGSVDLLARGSPGREAIFAEYYDPVQVVGELGPRAQGAAAERLARYRRRLRAVQSDGWRLLWASDGRHELYHLETDPGETRNLYNPERPPPAFATLSQRLADYVRRHGGERPLAPAARTAPEPLGSADDPALREALRALGYLE